MAKHDQTRDGGRPKEEVDPSKIVRPRDDDGKHSGDRSEDNSRDDEDEDDK